MKKIFLFILMLILAEVFFLIIYSSTNSNYFETINETKKRSAPYSQDILFTSAENIKKIKSRKNNVKKIAIFGGSSAAGYSSAISFADFLSFADKNFEVHNYAINGMPFSEFQSEILLKVIKNYDVIIIYAGHNEIHTSLNSKARETGKSTLLPNLTSLLNVSSYDNLKEILTELELGLLNGKTSKNFTSLIKNNSRIFLFTLRVFNKIRKLVEKKVTKFPYFGEINYLENNEREKIKVRFIKTISMIEKKLENEQLLIIIPAFSNDLFPPIYQHASKKNKSELSNINTLAKELYSQVKSDVLNQYLLEQLPSGPHKSYLLALECSKLIKKETLKYERINDKCISLFNNAREQDDLPFRALNYLSTAKNIRGGGWVSNTNIFFKEIAVNDYLKKEGVLSYMKLFVDFQHPSEIGHMMIANTILQIIFPNQEKKFKQLGLCSFQFSSSKTNELRILNPESYLYKHAVDINISWLKRFISQMPETELYEWYINIASKKKTSCGLDK